MLRDHNSRIGRRIAIALADPSYTCRRPACRLRPPRRCRPNDPAGHSLCWFAEFLGRPAKGYEAPACILTEPAAKALAVAQKKLAIEGLTLVVFDCYRPAAATADFIAWTGKGGAADPRWYPKVKRGDLIAEGYIGARSSHSRGSTVDVAIATVEPADTASPSCGAGDAGTLDFGTGFDCFDRTSETTHTPLANEARANRQKLVETMDAAGFRNYSREWWHFTLRREPYPAQLFDFPVTNSE